MFSVRRQALMIGPDPRNKPEDGHDDAWEVIEPWIVALPKAGGAVIIGFEEKG
jgi:hypothetical protein